MLAQIEALTAFAETGTMTAAATRLRVTQPAISKRIAQLESTVGHALVERSGRRLHLTAEGRALLDEVRPLLARLKAALSTPLEGASGTLTIGVSDSVLASWGAALIEQAARELPNVDLEINAHRSPAAIDYVRGGDYALALVAGQADTAPDLEVRPFAEEPMVLVPSGLDRASVPRRGAIPIRTIEEHSATWRALRRRLVGHPWGDRLEVVGRVQSFVALAQMARSGFGNALVPLGVARTLGLDEHRLVVPPRPKLTRPISLVGRPNRLRRETVAAFCRCLDEQVESLADYGLTLAR